MAIRPRRTKKRFNKRIRKGTRVLWITPNRHGIVIDIWTPGRSPWVTNGPCKQWPYYVRFTNGKCRALPASKLFIIG